MLRNWSNLHSQSGILQRRISYFESIKLKLLSRIIKPLERCLLPFFNNVKCRELFFIMENPLSNGAAQFDQRFYIICAI